MATPEVTRDKAAVFDKLLPKRVADIIDKLDTLGNLSNPYNYTFTEEKWEDAFKKLDASVAALKERAAKGLRDQPLVGTGRRKSTVATTAPEAPVQQQSEEPDTVVATGSVGSPELAETTSALLDDAGEAAKQAERDEIKRIEEEVVPAFLRKNKA